MKKMLFILISLFVYNLSFAEKIFVPELKGPVTDLTNTLTTSEIKNIKNKLLFFEKSNNAQIIVLLIPTTGEESIEEFSIRLAEEWKIGSKKNDDGVILLIAKNDRKLRIEVGYGLENTITDAEASYIIDNLITPLFKKGRFYSGINNGIDRIIGLIIGISTSIDEIENNNEHQKESFGEVLAIILGILSVFTFIVPWFLLKSSFKTMAIVIIIILTIATSSGLLAKDETDSRFILVFLALCFTVIPFLINLIGTLTGKKKNWNFSNGGSSSGRSSYSSSSSWSSSSSSSSYSGGGGSFGGGGASGSW